MKASMMQLRDRHRSSNRGFSPVEIFRSGFFRASTIGLIAVVQLAAAIPVCAQDSAEIQARKVAASSSPSAQSTSPNAGARQIKNRLDELLKPAPVIPSTIRRTEESSSEGGTNESETGTETETEATSESASGGETEANANTDASTVETNDSEDNSATFQLGAGDSSSPTELFPQRNLGNDLTLLKGQISSTKGKSPLLMGSIRQMEPGTKIDLVVPEGMFLNSEVSQKGDEVMMRIACDVKDGERVVLPGGWFVRGLVTDSVNQKRLGRDGYVEVEFDKLVSPDGDYELDFNAKFSSKDSKLKSAAKVVAIDSGYVAAGAGAGALLSVQLAGIGTAIATYGISVGIGAGVGASIGLFGALKRKGQIRTLLPGESFSLTTAEPITLPGFDPSMLLSAAPPAEVEGLDLTVNDYKFRKSPWDDKSSKLLEVDLNVVNKTKEPFHFFDLRVMSDHYVYYDRVPIGGFKAPPDVAPQSEGDGKILYGVGSSKRKYFLVLYSRRTGKELTRVAIN